MLGGVVELILSICVLGLNIVVALVIFTLSHLENSSSSMLLLPFVTTPFFCALEGNGVLHLSSKWASHSSKASSSGSLMTIQLYYTFRKTHNLYIIWLFRSHFYRGKQCPLVIFYVLRESRFLFFLFFFCLLIPF